MHPSLPLPARRDPRRGALALLAPAAAASVIAAAVTISALCGWMAAAGVAAGVLAALAGMLWLDEHRASRLRRELAQGVSHEMRTPLAHIRMFNEMLLLREEPDEEQRRWLEVVGREALRLGDLVENLLSFAHDEGPGEGLVREQVDLGALLEDVAAECGPLASARGMRIDADPPAGVLAEASPRALRQALTNLVDNAVRHGSPGQTVTLSLHAGSGSATLAVGDQGPGVPSRERERMWKPFVRGGATGGIGLGLAVVRRIAAAHGGRAFVEDAPGGGSRFGIVVPTVSSVERPNRFSEVGGLGVSPLAGGRAGAP